MVEYQALSNGNVKIVKNDLSLDRSTNAVNSIDYAHHETHAGSSYHMSAVDTDMGDGDTLNIIYTVPDQTKEIHMTITWSTKAGGHIELLRNPDITGGTALTPINNNGNFALTKPSSLTGTAYNASISGGLQVDRLYSFGVRSSSLVNHNEEGIMISNADYAVVYTADGGSNAGFIRLDWYEHTPKR